MTVTLDLGDIKSDSSVRRSLSDLSLSVAKCKKIVVVTGAGISCSSGIPDFRSSDGLYNLVKQQYPDVVLKGRDLFDASLFRDTTSTSVFFTFISQLKRSIDAAKPTATHKFIKTLDSKKKLLRSYTQNIDGLEERVGLIGSSSQDAQGKGKGKINTKVVKNVQLHGDIHRVRCSSCSAEYPCTSGHLDMFEKGQRPDCPECVHRSEARVARSARAIKVGGLRPAIVLYDEPHPLGDDIGTIQTADLSRKPDMLIIMGTSLKVHGLKKLVKDFARTVHAQTGNPSVKPKSWTGKVLFINRTPPGAEWAGIIDYHVAGETDVWVEKVIEDWKKMRPSDWELQQTLVGEGEKIFKTVKESTTKAVKGTRKATGDENIPPTAMELSTPDHYRLFRDNPQPSSSPPSSPTKRRTDDSHYNSGHSSPSKKRQTSSDDLVFDSDLHRVLFADSTNADDVGALAADLSMQDLTCSPLKPKPVTLAKSTRRTFVKTTSADGLLFGQAAPKRRFTRTRTVEDDVFT